MILDLLFGNKRQLTPAASDDFWYGKGPIQGTSAGVRVDEDTALNYSAVWAATRILAETLASLPRWVYEILPGGGKDTAPDHHLYHLLQVAPNPEMDAFTWWERNVAHAVNWGNAFNEIERTHGGRPLHLWPIHPSRVPPPRRDKYGKLVYLVRNNTGTATRIPAHDMFHIVGVLSDDGLWGKGAVTQGRESIGMGLSTERYGATFFGNGARPGGVLEHPGRLSDVASKNLRESWNRVHQGPGAGHNIAVLQEGMKYAAIDIPPEDAQFLQTRQHNITEIARWYRIPVHLLAELTRSTNNNIEAENLGFVIHSLRPWIVRIEHAVRRQLFLPGERRRYFLEFLLDALLRGDLATRTGALAQQFLNGELTLNEWRAIENRNPIGPAGDRHYLQAQMVPLPDLDAPASEAVVDQDPATPAGSGQQPGAAPGQAPESPVKPPRPAGDGDALIDLPDIRQEFNFDCGAAAAMAVGAYFGVGPATLEEWRIALGTTEKDSTRPMAIVEYFLDLGLSVTATHGMSVDDLAACWKKGMPVLTPIQEYGIPSKQASFEYGHYVVVIGVALGQIFVQDPSFDNALEEPGGSQGETEDPGVDAAPGRMMIDEDTWMAVWHDVDADGKPYIQFGIAVGQGPPVESPQGDGDKTSPDADKDKKDKPAEEPPAGADGEPSGEKEGGDDEAGGEPQQKDQTGLSSNGLRRITLDFGDEPPRLGHEDQPRDDNGRWSSGTSDGKEPHEGGGDLHAEAHGAAKSWGQWAKEIPGKVAAAAKAKVADKFSQLENRYGRKMAVAILGAGIAGAAIPVPGTSLIAAAPLIAGAELYRHFRGKQAQQQSADGDRPRYTDEEIRAIGQHWIAELVDDWKANDAPGLEEEFGKESQSAAAPGQALEFREEDHPRDERGRFGSGDGGRSKDHQAVIDGMSKAIDRADLTDEQKDQYKKAWSDVVDRLPLAAVHSIQSNVKRANFYPSSEALTDALRERSPNIKGVAAGAYGIKDESLHLDGGANRSGQSASEVYAHELGHAVDGPSRDISSSPAWRDAYNSEVANGRLGKYAAADPKRSDSLNAAEGLAEFNRAVHGGKYDPDQVAQKFPKCTQVFKDNGLW